MEVLEPDLSKRKDIDKVIKEMNKIIENLDDFDAHLWQSFQSKANCECAKCKSQQPAKIQTETSPSKHSLLDLVMCRIKKWFSPNVPQIQKKLLLSSAGGKGLRAKSCRWEASYSCSKYGGRDSSFKMNTVNDWQITIEMLTMACQRSSNHSPLTFERYIFWSITPFQVELNSMTDTVKEFMFWAETQVGLVVKNAQNTSRCSFKANFGRDL